MYILYIGPLTVLIYTVHPYIISYKVKSTVNMRFKVPLRKKKTGKKTSPLFQNLSINLQPILLLSLGEKLIYMFTAGIPVISVSIHQA